MEGMCRLCLSQQDVLIPIFYQGSDMPANIRSCLDVQVSADDSHKHICTMCDKRLREWWNFKMEIQSAQKFLNMQKQLYSRTVTSTGENQNLSDMSRSSTPKSDASRHDGFRPVAGFIQQEKVCDSDQAHLGGRRNVLPSTSSEPNSYFLSSSSSGRANGHKPAASTNSQRQRGSIRSHDEDDSIIVDLPPKRKAPLVTLDKGGNKRSKVAEKTAKKVPEISEPGKSSSKVSKVQSQQSESGDSLKCPYCPSTFPDKLGLTPHLKFHSVNRRFGKKHIKCPYCPIGLQVYSLRGHVRNVHKMDPEAACILNYIEDKFSKAGKASTNAEGMKMVVFPCNLCKNSYKNLMALKVHKKKFHAAGANSNLLKVKPKAIKKNTTCDKCNRRMFSVKAVAIHKQYCGTDRASVCPFCQKQFESVQRLKRHITEKHSGGAKDTGEPPLSADSTTKASANTGPVVKNPQSEPGSIPPQKQAVRSGSKHKCSQCTRSFHSAIELEDHLKYCGSQKAFKCGLCPYQYNSPRSCDIHSSNVHRKLVIPCDFCNRKFSSRSELHEHRKIHRQQIKSKLLHKCRSCQNVYNGVKIFNDHKHDCRQAFEYKCDKCFLHFKHEDSLHNHVPQCVGKSRFEEKLKLSLKTIKCLQCTQKFVRENDFINHFVESHVNAANSIFSGVNTFDCHFCFYASKNPDSLRRHWLRCRGIEFHIVKSAAQKQNLASVQDSTGNSNEESSISSQFYSATQSTTSNKPSSESSSKSNDLNIEIPKICSPAFMNEHLNASKNVQVIVEKLSASQLHRASTDSIKIESTTSIACSPRNKVQCEFCRRSFTPAGFPSHRCHRRKKVMAQRAWQQSAEADATSVAVSIKCEICHEMIPKQSLEKHLKVIHKAANPTEMAQGMIIVSQNKPTIHEYMKQKVMADSPSDDESSSLPEISPQDGSDTEDVGKGYDEQEVFKTGDESLEESVLIECDICRSHFTLSELEVHLKDKHNAVHPTALAKTMSDNDVARITINQHIKVKKNLSAEEETSNLENSPDTEGNVIDNQEDEGDKEGNDLIEEIVNTDKFQDEENSEYSGVEEEED